MTKADAISSKSSSQKRFAPFLNKNEQTSFFKPLIQPKLTINQPGDKYEQEADAVAEKVMRMPDVKTEPLFFQPKLMPLIHVQRKCGACEQEEKLQRKEDEEKQPIQLKPTKEFDLQRKCEHCEQEENIQRKGEGNEGAGMTAPFIVHNALASAGQPLNAETRVFMESRFGYDFDNVQIHDDSVAHRSSKEVNALAFTHGNHIVFGDGNYQPGTDSGKHLLAHELAHVVQQSNTVSSNNHLGNSLSGVLQRQTPQQATPAPSQNKSADAWEKLYWDFQFAPALESKKIAKELIETPGDPEHIINHGLIVVDWLYKNGEPGLGRDLLQRILTEYRKYWGLQQSLPDEFMSNRMDGIKNIVGLGKDFAKAGDDKQAFIIFGTAYEFLSYHAQFYTTVREAGDLSQADVYEKLNVTYNLMREILGYYYFLEREAMSAGDQKAASGFHAKAVALVDGIKKNHTTSNPKQVEVAEVSRVQTSKGPALQYAGSNKAKTDLTALPGLTSPRQLEGGHSVKKDLSEVQNVLIAQEELQNELLLNPEITKAIGKKIDFHNTTQRQKVWQIMYQSYRKTKGFEALGLLMQLIGRYLKAYTVHPVYNIRDWGDNYLTSKFPADLTNRVINDCGVYALEVAWDVYKAVSKSSPKINIVFRLATFLDHVTLIIDDQSTGETYILNNDNIKRINQAIPSMEEFLRPRFRKLPESVDIFNDPPQPVREWTNVEEQVQKEYVMMMGDLSFIATPVYFYELGSTKDAARSLKAALWSKYIADISKIAAKQALFNAELKRIKPDMDVFDLQKVFSNGMKDLSSQIDALLPFANNRQELSTRVKALEQNAFGFLRIAERFVKGFAPFDEKHRFLFRYPAGSIHPLVRFAFALLLLEKLGQTLSQDEGTYVSVCRVFFKDLINNQKALIDSGRF
jgi:hypothetical protein